MTRETPDLRAALAKADSDVSLIHDFLYGRGGTMDEASAACWRIHDILRPLTATPEPAPARAKRGHPVDEARRARKGQTPEPAPAVLEVERLARAVHEVEHGHRERLLTCMTKHRLRAKNLAREYAALTATPSEATE